jgi:hypothetical protein
VFESHPARFWGVEDFLVPELADRLSEFLRRDASFERSSASAPPTAWPAFSPRPSRCPSPFIGTGFVRAVDDAQEPAAAATGKRGRHRAHDRARRLGP